VPYLHGGQELRRPFWWRTAAGARLLVWMTDSPHGIAYMEGNMLGLAESADLAEELLPEYLAALAEKPYPYSARHEWLGLLPDFEVTRQPYAHDLLHLRVQSVIADNAPPSVGPAEVVRAWNERWAAPELRVATNREFFELAEARLGNELDEWEGDWADWWADGIGSAARAVGANRRAQGAIRTAQTLHVLADRLGEEEPEWRVEADRGYEAMGLFDEHTWGAGNPWSDELERFDSGSLQWERKLAFGHDAHDRAQALLEAGAERLARVFAASGAAVASVLVVNGAARPRTDLVRVFVPASRVGGEWSLALVGPEGTPVPFVLEPQLHARFRPDGRWLSFLADDVPACGWARFDLIRGERPAEAERGAGTVLEDGLLRSEIDVELGVIVSLVDLASGRELVDGAGAFGFNGYVYDRYATAPRFNHLSGRVPEGARWLLGSRSLGASGASGGSMWPTGCRSFRPMRRRACTSPSHSPSSARTSSGRSRVGSRERGTRTCPAPLRTCARSDTGRCSRTRTAPPPGRRSRRRSSSSGTSTCRTGRSRRRCPRRRLPRRPSSRGR
jgi:hypothetical protein